jgi:hypothetical protein
MGAITSVCCESDEPTKPQPNTRPIRKEPV